MDNFAKKILLTLAFVFSAKSYADAGLGIVLGQPSGLSGRIKQSSNTSWDAAAAWSLGESSYLLLHADHLWFKNKVVKIGHGADFFYGLGAILALPSSDIAVALRIPAGLSYTFADPVVEIFGELAVAFTVIPSTDFDIVGVIGARYWF